MPFRYLVCSSLLIGLMLACNSGEQDRRPDQLQDVLSEEVLQLIQAHWQAADSVGIQQADLHFRTIANLYVEHQQWDSLYKVNRQVFKKAYRSDSYDDAFSFFQHYIHQIPSARDTIKAKILELIGFSHYRLGQYLSAEVAYRSSAHIWEQHPFSPRLLSCYNMLGIVYTIFGEYPKAIQTYQAAIVFGKKLQDTTRLEAYYDNLGKAYLASQNPEMAIHYYQAGKRLNASPPGKYELRLGEAYLESGQLQKAVATTQKALQEMALHQTTTRLSFTTAYQTLAETYLLQQKYPQAKQYAQQAVSAALEEYPDGHREIGKSYVYLGESSHLIGESSSALEHLQTALKIFVPGFSSSEFTALPDTELLIPEGWLMVCLKLKGQVFEARYQLSNNTADLQNAANHYQLAIYYINQIKQFYSEKDSKRYWGDYSIPYIEKAIHTQLQLYAIDAQLPRLDTAFQLAQSANAFLLRERLTEDEALQMGNIPKDTLQVIAQQKKIIRELREALSTTLSDHETDSLNTLLFQQNRQLEQRNAYLSSFPNYYKNRYAIPLLSLKAIQQQLKPKELLIKYFMGKQQLYTFALTQDQQRVYTTPIDSSLLHQIRAYRESTAELEKIRQNTEQAEKQFLQSAHELYNRLLHPALQELDATTQCSSLIIIPDNIISYLSFDGLLHRASESWLDIEAFLIHRYAIRYHYAVGVIGRQFSSPPLLNTFLGFGIEYDQAALKALELVTKDTLIQPQIKETLRSKKLAKLRYADDEVLTIAEDLKGKTFINQAATKEQFLKHSPSYSVLHIAAHSFIGENPDLPSAYLVFQPEHQQEDYLLSLSEVVDLPLNAELVVLSACQTGTGQLLGSEGVMSLARAFQIAGSNSILASQWSISDQTSATIMKAFYKNLQAGMSKSAALRAAKLEYLSSDQLSSPAFRIPGYWAASILLGSDEEMKFEASDHHSSLLFIVIGLLLFIGLLGYFRSKQTTT